MSVCLDCIVCAMFIIHISQIHIRTTVHFELKFVSDFDVIYSNKSVFCFGIATSELTLTTELIMSVLRSYVSYSNATCIGDIRTFMFCLCSKRVEQLKQLCHIAGGEVLLWVLWL